MPIWDFEGGYVVSTQPHVLVLGLGITGSAVAATLAVDGIRVTAFEQFTRLHDRGSSHGDTRIYRRVPHEGAIYVEMATSSWDGWQDWSGKAGEQLLVDCGGIDAGPEDSAIVCESQRLCRDYGQSCEMLTGAAFNRRYPHFNLPSVWSVAYQPHSGFVRPDATRTFLHKMARSAGARLVHETRIIDIDLRPAGVTLRSEQDSVSGDILIVAAGSWLLRLLPGLELPLVPERRVLAWFQPNRSEALTDGRLPIFCLDGEGGWYGMPTPEGMLKLGHDKHLGQRIDPDQPPLQPGDADAAKLTPCIERYFRGFSAQPSAMKTCIYTLTPDHHFITDRHPVHANVFLFSCCSGHGFKYAPAYGKIALDFVAGRPRPDLAAFGIKRNGGSTTRFSE
jgi:sarcosine oxidase